MHNAELRKVFEALSFEGVRTVISSGNVLFETDRRGTATLESLIEGALLDHLDAPCSTILRDRRQIEQLAELDLFDSFEDGPSDRCNVTFLKRMPAVQAPDVGPGARIVAVQGQTVFSVIDTTSSKTPDLMAKLERAYGKEITTRTWKTVHRIVKAFGR